MKWGRWFLVGIAIAVVLLSLVACNALSGSTDSAADETTSTATLPVGLDRVYGKWQTEGHELFPHWDVWEFLEDGTLYLTSQATSTEATGVFFFNCDSSMLTDEQLATVPHWLDDSSAVFSEHCNQWIKDPDLEGKDFYSFAYQVNPPEYDSSIDGSHAVMIISFTDSNDTMVVHIASVGVETIRGIIEEPLVLERTE